MFWRIKRYQGIQEEQARRLRRRSLRIGFKKGTMRGTMWTCGPMRAAVASTLRQGSAQAGSATGVSAAASAGSATVGYSREFARDVISNIRTDLDAFNEVETGVLMNHGYLSAAGAMSARVQGVGRADVPVAPPFPEFLPPRTDEVGLRVALKDSGARKTFGRG